MAFTILYTWYIGQWNIVVWSGEAQKQGLKSTCSWPYQNLFGFHNFDGLTICVMSFGKPKGK